MPQQTECIADDGRLHVLKLQRRQRRSLEVEVFSPGDRLVGSASLPRRVDWATIDGLDPQVTYEVRVRRARRLVRAHHPERTFLATPRTRDLRVLSRDRGGAAPTLSATTSTAGSSATAPR